MAANTVEFRGSKNLHLGESPTNQWATSVWDHDAREYVIALDEANAKRFRPLAAEYGFHEVTSQS